MMEHRIPAIVEAKLRRRAARVTKRVFSADKSDDRLGFCLHHLDGTRALHVPAKSKFRHLAFEQQLALLKTEWLEANRPRHLAGLQQGVQEATGVQSTEPETSPVSSPVPQGPAPAALPTTTVLTTTAFGGSFGEDNTVYLGGRRSTGPSIAVKVESSCILQPQGDKTSCNGSGSRSRALVVWSPRTARDPALALNATVEDFPATPSLAGVLRSPPTHHTAGALRAWASGMVAPTRPQRPSAHAVYSTVIVRGLSSEPGAAAAVSAAAPAAVPVTAPAATSCFASSAAATSAASVAPSAPAGAALCGTSATTSAGANASFSPSFCGECSALLVLMAAATLAVAATTTAASVATVAAAAAVVAAAAAAAVVVAAALVTLALLAIRKTVSGNGSTRSEGVAGAAPTVSSRRVGLTPMSIERFERPALSPMDISPEPLGTQAPPGLSPMEIDA